MKQPTLRPAPGFDHYKVVRDYEPDSLGEQIVVPRDFRYDGASIPAAAWQATYPPFHPDVMAAALVHDWLYYNHQVEQEPADDLFFAILRANGVGMVKASAMWVAVRNFGGLFWENDEEDERFLVTLCQKAHGRPNFDRYRFPPEVIARC